MNAPETAAERALRITLEDVSGTGARIKVIGVGGGGNNAVDRMVAAGLGEGGVEFVVANTDRQALEQNNAPVRLQIGGKLTNGLGAGADPAIGERAALEDTEQLLNALAGADMVFVTAGLGGGTGTGAAPIVTSLASELGALTVAAVTTPFTFEGRVRARRAQQGLVRLHEAADSVITIPNDRLLSTIDRQMPLTAAFEVVDDVLHQAIRGISDLVLVPGLINLDFADLKTTMSSKGTAIMGTGTGTGESRALDAATRAVSSPLLDHDGLEGARSVIVNVTGGSDLSMIEVSEATTAVQEAAHEDANIIFGAVIDPAMGGDVKITVIATEFDPVTPAETEEISTAVAVASAPTPNDLISTAVAVASAPTPNDLNAYVVRQQQDVEAAERAASVAGAPSSGVVGEHDATDIAPASDAEEMVAERVEMAIADDALDHPTAAAMGESATEQAIAKARALSSLAISRRPTFELPVASDPAATASGDMAADIDIGTNDDTADDVEEYLPAFLRSAGE